MIGAAAADVASHGEVDVAVAGLRNLAQQAHRRHDLPRLAIAALRHVERDPGRAHRIRDLAVRALNRHHVGAVEYRHGRDARAPRLTVEVHSAGPALGYATPELGARQPLYIAKKPEQRHRGVAVIADFGPVHVQRGHRCLVLWWGGYFWAREAVGRKSQGQG